ncbi:MAG: mscL, partial [Phycisphaerales bacterium]|nr:mscL [Phycisphaerales bacterium]
APPAAAPPPEKAVEFTWMIGRFKIGDFIGALLNFLIIAFAVFVVIVKLLGSVMKKVGGTPKPSEPTTKECPECLSLIPLRAKRCAYCTAVLPPVPSPATATPGGTLENET